jgi:hypothetical protein
MKITENNLESDYTFTSINPMTIQLASWNPTPVGCTPVQVILCDEEDIQAIVGISQVLACNGALQLN